LWKVHDHSDRSSQISEPRINDRIRVPEVRLVGPAGEQVGIVRIEDALRLAAESDLDLVEVAPTAKPPVCKLMDFGKYKYEAAVKAREARKNQTNTVLKEIRFRLKIDKHDYETKRGHALRFLGAGDKVKAMIQFRGREQQRPEMGIRLLQKFAEDVAEVGVVESTPRIDGRNMVMVIGPVKNKAEAKAEARRAAQQNGGDKDKHESRGGRAAKPRVDVSRDNKAPMTQSLGDMLPENLRQGASPETTTTEAPAAPSAPAAPVESSAPSPASEPAQAAVPTRAAEPAQATEAAPPAAPAQSEPAEQAPAEAPAPTKAAKPAAAPKSDDTAAPKPAARPAAAPKPTAMPKPAPKPSAVGHTAPKPVPPKPSAPKPGNAAHGAAGRGKPGPAK